MQLLSSLVAGIHGAENGFAKIRVRGTSALATVYSDFIGTVMAQPASGLVLDANGGTIVYVNQLVDVEVLDQNGSGVRTFVEGVASPNVEVQSSSMTGTSYTSTATGVGKPTNLQTVIDRVNDSFGSIDWNVLFNGGSTRLQDALGSIGGVFINVKSPAYAAKGDGTTDDTAAIQAALNAAQPLAAIVVFPAGTYRLTSKLTVASGVSLWGLGAQASIITMDHASADTLEYATTSSTWYQEIRGLQIKASQANTGKFVSMPSGGRLVMIVESVIGDSAHTGDIVVAVSGFLKIQNSAMIAYTSGGVNVSANVRFDTSDSYYAALSSAYTGTLLTCQSGTVFSSRFALGNSSGTSVCLSILQTAQISIIGNTFGAPSGGTSTALSNAANDANTAVSEAGSTFTGTFTNNYSGFTTAAANPQIQMVTRESKIRNVTDNSASVALQGHLYGVVVVTRTAAGGAQAFTTAVGPEGSFLTVIIYNNSGGALSADITLNGGGSGFYAGSPNITKPANTKVSIAQFRAVYTAGTACYVPLATYQTSI